MNPWQALMGDVPVPGDYWPEPVKRNGHDIGRLRKHAPNAQEYAVAARLAAEEAKSEAAAPLPHNL